MLTQNLNMFIKLQGSCDQNKIKADKKMTPDMWFQIFVRVASF